MDSKEPQLGPRPVPPPAEYEACAPGALPSGQAALVRSLQEKFLGAFVSALAARLETPVTAGIAAVQTLSRAAFLQSGEDGGCQIALDTEPVRDQALVAFPPGLAAFLLRVLLCAPPESSGEPRAVTEIELYILREIFESLAHELTAAWESTGMVFQPAATPASDAGSGQDSMLVFECRVDLDAAQESFRIAIPAFLARVAALQSASAAPEESPAPVREMIFNALRRGNVCVEAALSGSTLRMGDLLAMEPGHVLMLGQPAGSPVECRIGGKTKFRGEWVRHGNRPALLLL